MESLPDNQCLNRTSLNPYPVLCEMPEFSLKVNVLSTVSFRQHNDKQNRLRADF